ncbi:hypothetical protein CMI37_04285 [Candidatus Pacearchaeota archaeon]|nr:hypothetical protein [Candidatus Pacearchaeota archaeon]|tara:strand:- start:1888 stop:2739 length:852 start_codon:yes stop_codon:yes gene_type:complete
MERKDIHEKILYPVTRVRASDSGGSGVLIYSEPDPQKPDEFINIALTCQHVIDKNITVKEEWDAVLKRDMKRDIMQEVTVEIFDYDGSKIVSANSTSSEIIAYDKSHDLAAVKLNNTRKMNYVSTVIPKEDIKDVHIADPVWVSGCSLLHDPFPNSGTLTSLREMIDQKAYIMQNAPSIFGNSGGGLFHGVTGHLLGLTSRITVTQLGFGMDVQSWMGFSTHPDRLYEFFDHQELQFLYDHNDNYYDAMKRRDNRRKETLRSVLVDGEDSKPTPVSPPEDFVI